MADKDPAGAQGDQQAPAPAAGKESSGITSIFNFYGKVDGAVGLSGLKQSPRRKTTGKIDADDIGAAVRHYVEPPCYPQALDALVAGNVVIIEGENGTGRRSAAIVLLREVTDGPLIMLPPLSTLQDLAQRKYERDHGYVVMDRREERTGRNTDFTWRTVRDALREAGAYLVVTTANTAAGRATETVRHVGWSCPPVEKVLRAHLDPIVCDETVEAAVKAVPSRWTMTNVARMAEQISNGVDVAKAAEEFDVAATQAVRQWFEDGDRTPIEIIEATTLAFLNRANIRTFESMRTKLFDEIALQLGITGPSPEERTLDELPMARSRRLTADGLIEEVVAADGPNRRALAFKVASYRHLLLEQLWRNCEVPFWDGVRNWLSQLIHIEEILLDLDGVEMMYGLSLLAEVAWDEVERTYLEPWSKGDAGWQGQIAAAYVLWGMCHSEELAAAALETAFRWSQDGTTSQRQTAALAYSGELGLCSPVEAVRRLWHLMVSNDDVREIATDALAALFAKLIDESDRGVFLLRALERQCGRYLNPGPDRRMLNLTLEGVLAVMTVQAHRTTRPVIFDFLQDNPQHARLVAGLWWGLLRHRGFRRRAVDALFQCLMTVVHSPGESHDGVRTLGHGLGEVLPPQDRESLQIDIKIARDLPRWSNAYGLATVLLDAVGQQSLPHQQEER